MWVVGLGRGDSRARLHLAIRIICFVVNAVGWLARFRVLGGWILGCRL